MMRRLGNLVVDVAAQVGESPGSRAGAVPEMSAPIAQMRTRVLGAMRQIMGDLTSLICQCVSGVGCALAPAGGFSGNTLG
jgi:hypothetical protein